jgi:hypothetical protein
LVSDPERGQQEPHEIAKAFCEYLHGESDDPQWEPVALPELLLMPCVGSQGQPALPGAHSLEHDKGLKRKYVSLTHGPAKSQTDSSRTMTMMMR